MLPNRPHTTSLKHASSWSFYGQSRNMKSCKTDENSNFKVNCCYPSNQNISKLSMFAREMDFIFSELFCVVECSLSVCLHFSVNLLTPILPT